MDKHIAKSKRWLDSAAEMVSSMIPMGIATWDVRGSVFLASFVASLGFALVEGVVNHNPWPRSRKKLASRHGRKDGRPHAAGPTDSGD
jgi:hypothetical protein